MSYANPIWLEGRRKYWTRPDAYRFAPPGSPEAKMPGWIDPWATRVRAKEAAEDEARARAAAAQEEFEREFLQLRWEVKKLKLEHELWCFEQKYSPNQPRSPKGNPDGGQWVRDAGKEGNLVSTADAAGRSTPMDVSAARRRSGISEAECDAQYKQDKIICNLVRTPLCWAQAAERYAACLSGRPLPPLNF